MRKHWAFWYLLSALWVYSSAARAEDPVDTTYRQAIDAVYPTLVQIFVIGTTHQGGRELKVQGSGSGAIISPDGYVVTNHHVAGNAVAIRCVMSTKEELSATLVGTDALTDIAIVKLDLKDRKAGMPPLPVARWGDSNTLKVGDTVLAMGCPLSLSQSVTKGIVANKDMILSRGVFLLDGEDVGSLVKWIGHDATIQPGNSGGPLVNISGEIIGINEIGVGQMSGAIPSDIARETTRRLIEEGKVTRAFVGISFQPLLKSMQAQLPPNTPNGVLISGVVPGTPGELGGLRAGDIVLAVDDQPIEANFREQLPPLQKLLAIKPIGQSVKFKVKRGAEELTLGVKADPRDDARGKEIESKEWGLTLRRITLVESKAMQRSDVKGVLVGSVREGGPSNKAQPALFPSDVIVEVAGKPVPDLESLLKITAEIIKDKTEPIPTVVVFERSAERYVTLVEVGIRPPQEPAPEAKKGWMALKTQVLSKKLATALKLKGKKGVVITQVFPESNAEQDGIKPGDIFTHINTELIEASEPQDLEVFATMIRAYAPGAKAELSGFRDGQPLKVSTTITEGPKSERELKTYDDTTLEFKARDIAYMDRVKHRWSKEQQGALISQVDASGWAAVGGLVAGDLLLSIDGKAVADVQELEKVLKALLPKCPQRITLFVKRGITSLFVELEPHWREPALKANAQ